MWPQSVPNGYLLTIIKDMLLSHIMLPGKINQTILEIKTESFRYDGQFILEQLITSSNMSPKLILEGTKLVFMEYNNVRILDSMKFWTTSLSGLGKSFEVDSIKGYV